MKIAIASDHAGFEMKTALVEMIAGLGHEVADLGTNSLASCDYPIFGARVGTAVATKEADLGILVCGTGVGIGISANKIPGIRCVICSDTFSARMSREHNDANVLSIGARVIGIGLAEEIVKVWLSTDFGGDRHARRVGQINALDRGETIE